MTILRRVLHAGFLAFLASAPVCLSTTYAATDAPAPLLKQGQPVDWWFVFKFNTAVCPGCAEGAARHCLFGGEVQEYPNQGFGQQYVYASSANQTLAQGSDCAGDTIADPVGATFDEVYNGTNFYVIWNDQFYDDPGIASCTKACGAPWGHSKGLLTWNDSGAGFVMQVTTPSWPAAGSKGHPRKSDGNTLGCVHDDNVKVSQHFFALKLTKADVVTVLHALANASIVTDPDNPQIVNNGGPADVSSLVEKLGKQSPSTRYTKETLSSGIALISKPSRLNVPPWQLVSASLGGVPLRAATWWARPKIATTTSSTNIGCWESTLGTPGPVEIATTGQWQGTPFGLTGGPGRNFNHAKIGVSLSASAPFTIFGDMNQQGTLSGTNCASSQNGRGGLFYVLSEPTLAKAVSELVKGDSASAEEP